VRGASGQAVAGMAPAARPPGAAATTARLTAALAVTLGVAAACWVIAIRQMSAMDMGVSTRRGSFRSFTVLWLVTMAAMMLPGAAPAAVRRARATGRLLAAPLFAVSYLAVWVAAGLGVYALDRPHGRSRPASRRSRRAATNSPRSRGAADGCAKARFARGGDSGCPALDRAPG
jgi:predicted metal-binding membrane protein